MITNEYSISFWGDKRSTSDCDDICTILLICEESLNYIHYKWLNCLCSISINLLQLKLNLKNTKRPHSEINKTNHRIFTSNITDRNSTQNTKRIPTNK